MSLAALRWLADQDAAFVMLDRDGSVLATTGPVRPSDARLRRAQALAIQSGAALQITKELIGKKLAGQEQNSVCEICGTSIPHDHRFCVLCVTSASKEQLAEVAKRGRVAAQSPEAQVRRSDTKRRHDMARRGWLASSQPAWLNNETYEAKIQPQLAGITYSAIASALNVSLPYSADIRSGRRRPHPRHWQVLAQLVNVAPSA